MSASPHITGRVSEPVRQDPEILNYTAILERDLGAEQDENGRLRLRVQNLKAQLAKSQSQVVALQAELSRKRFRRFGAEEAAAARVHLPNQRKLWLGPLVLDIPMRQLMLAGRSIYLTQNELGILGHLMERPDTVVATTTLAAVIGSNPSGDAVRTYISRLRPKLREIGADVFLRAHKRTFAGGGQWMTATPEQGDPS